jgi:hypothetical protein
LFGTLVGLVAAIMAITAALVFATNLDGLVTSPTRYGWTWDVLVDSYNQEVSPDLLSPPRRTTNSPHSRPVRELP